jgi:hypothetical protein
VVDGKARLGASYDHTGDETPAWGRSTMRATNARAHCLGLILTVAWGLPATADGQVVSGWVVRADGTPIPDAAVLLRGDAGGVLARADSGPNGHFELHPGSAGRMRLEVTHLGYADWETADFDLTDDDDLEVLVSLQFEPVPLEEVMVEARRQRTTRLLADFERRKERQAFGGFFLEEDDIARRPASRPSNLVLAAPGMSVRGGAGAFDQYVILSGDCPATVYIDGARIDQMTVSVDEYLDLTRIAGVEVYPRAMSAPPQYQDALRGDCGTVLYWTKELEPSGPGGWSTTKIVLAAASFTGLLFLTVVK